MQALGVQSTAARAHEVMTGGVRTGGADTGCTAIAASEGAKDPSVDAHSRPPLSETHQALEQCLNLWPAMHAAQASEDISSEDSKQQGDKLFKSGDMTGEKKLVICLASLTKLIAESKAKTLE